MRWANGVWGLVAVVVLSAAAGGCSDDDGGGSSLSREALAEAGNECPVDLAAAVDAAGLEAGDATVEVIEGSGDGGEDAAAIDQVGGVYVDCTQPVADGGEVTAIVFASEQPGAVGLLLPQISRDLGFTTDDLEGVFETVQRTDVGELADLDGEGAAAVARVDVDGAESGVLYVSSSGVSPDDVRTIAEHLLA